MANPLDDEIARQRVAATASALDASQQAAPVGPAPSTYQQDSDARAARMDAESAADAETRDINAHYVPGPRRDAEIARRERRHDIAFQQERQLSEEEFRNHQAAAENSRRDEAQVLNQARGYEDLASSRLTRKLQTQSVVDSAEVLRKLHDVDLTAPGHEAAVAGILAEHPLGDSPNVRAAMAVIENGRQKYLDAVKLGGAGRYEEGPARTVFERTLDKTKDPYAAHTAAEATALQDAQLLKDRDAGLITDADFSSPAINPDGSANLNRAVGVDGLPNYAYLRKVAATRAGGIAGLPAKEADKTQQEARQNLGLLARKLSEGEALTPDEKVIHEYSTRVLADAIRGQKPAAAGEVGTVVEPAKKTSASYLK